MGYTLKKYYQFWCFFKNFEFMIIIKHDLIEYFCFVPGKRQSNVNLDQLFIMYTLVIFALLDFFLKMASFIFSAGKFVEMFQNCHILTKHTNNSSEKGTIK